MTTIDGTMDIIMEEVDSFGRLLEKEIPEVYQKLVGPNEVYYFNFY
jgi:hypothetical protein